MARRDLKTRIVNLLRNGPRTPEAMGEVLGHTSKVVCAACRELKAQGLLKRLPNDNKHAVYDLARAATESTTMRGLDYRAAEDAYVVARKAGGRPHRIALDLGLTATSAEKFESSYRSQTTAATSRDSSCPKFANDGMHLGALATVGPYPAMHSRATARISA